MQSLGTATQVPDAALDWETHLPAAGSHHSPLSQPAPMALPQGCPAATACALSWGIETMTPTATRGRAKIKAWGLIRGIIRFAGCVGVGHGVAQQTPHTGEQRMARALECAKM
jgi:hypothetical protein